MKITHETITPKAAARYLEHNDNNRHLRKQTVDLYANEMTAGRWKSTGEPIQFFTDGTVANGQHRLHAIIKSGVTVEMVVVRGLSKEAMSGIDVGAKRTVGDYLNLHHGIVNSTLVAAAARQIISMLFAYQNYGVSADIILKVLNNFGPQIEKTVAAVSGFQPARKAWVVAAIAFAMKSHPTEVQAFLHTLATGENASRGNPAFTFRNWLINNSSTHLKANYRRGAYESIFNALHNAVHNNKLVAIKSGVNGVNYFTSKQRKFAEYMRDECKHIIAR